SFCSTGFQPVPCCATGALRHGLKTSATAVLTIFFILPVFAVPKLQTGGIVNLPYTTPDGKSPCWIIQQGGWLQQRRVNMDDTIYGQMSMLMIDQNNPNQNNNQARVDPKTGEVVLEGFQPVDGVQVTRRIQVRREDD